MINKGENKKHSVLFLVGVLIAGLFLGFIIGEIRLHFLYDYINAMSENIVSFKDNFLLNAHLIASCIIIFFIVIGAALFLIGKKEFENSVKADDEFYNEKLLTISLYLFSFGNIFNIILLAVISSIQTLSIVTKYNSQVPTGKAVIPTLIVVAFILISYFYYTVMQNKIVETIKKVYPDKKGDVYSLSFNKQWFKSMDEAEKKQAYYAGYKALENSNKALYVIAFVLGLIGIQVQISFMVYFVITVLFLVNMLSYMYFSFKKPEE